MTRRSSQGRAAAALLFGSGQARENGDGSLRTAYPTAISGTLRQRGLASARCSAGRSLRESSRNRRRELSPERHHARTLPAARAGPGRVLVDDQPARRISLHSARARLNSTLTTDHASALQRVQHHAQDAVDAEPGMPEAGGGGAPLKIATRRAGTAPPSRAQEEREGPRAPTPEN